MSEPKSLKEAASGRTDLYRIDPRIICIKPGLNSRDKNFDAEDPEDLALAMSIKEIGVKVPYEVFWEDNKVWISDGHRRQFAVIYGIKHLGSEIKTVPCQIVDKHSNEADRIVSQLIRNSGKPLTSMEKAKVYKKLLDLGWKATEIATKVGVTPARISQILDLLAMPEQVKQMVQEGTVSPTLAVQTVKAAGDTKAIEVLTGAAEAAKADGRSRAKPSDMPTQVIKNPLTVIKECFEASDIDNSEDNGVVIISMPDEEFEKVRNLLKL